MPPAREGRLCYTASFTPAPGITSRSAEANSLDRWRGTARLMVRRRLGASFRVTDVPRCRKSRPGLPSTIRGSSEGRLENQSDSNHGHRGTGFAVVQRSGGLPCQRRRNPRRELKARSSGAMSMTMVTTVDRRYRPENQIDLALVHGRRVGALATVVRSELQAVLPTQRRALKSEFERLARAADHVSPVRTGPPSRLAGRAIAAIVGFCLRR